MAVMSPFAKAPNLFAVGFFATAVGYGSTYALQQARKVRQMLPL
jgi:hypothetical protein